MKQVVMLGPAPGSRGGMASVIACLLAHGYADGGGCRFIATQVDAGTPRKLAVAGAAFVRVFALLARGRVALLHVHVASGASFWRKAVFIACARLFRCPVLFHLHGGQFQEFIDCRLGRRRRRLALALIGTSRAAFALSAASAAWLRERAGVRQVEVFPNPVAACATPPRRRGRDVLFLGRLERSKGVVELVHSFAAASTALPGARLVLAGEGDQAALAALAARLGIADRLVLPGWVDAPARAALLASAAVLVLPSYNEQMPMVLLEAMACGTPVIATKVGAIPEMLDNGKCGILLAEKDTEQLTASILCIMHDNILADTLSARALERVETTYLAALVIERLRRRYEEFAA